MRTLYPKLQPYHSTTVEADEIHTLYVEECGNPQGLPVLFLHGGPGGGCTPVHRRFFDPKRYRIVLFDQRGCGKSIPHAELANNSTANLIQDIENLRIRLGINRWLVFGGSWGSTLALAYAQNHPDRILALVLRGIFLCRDEDIQWFYQQGTSRLFPDYWQDYLQPITKAERGDMVSAYYRHLTSDNETERLVAAKAWSIWEGRTATLLPNEQTEQYFGRPEVAISMARIECHYFINNAFLKPNQLLHEAHKIKDIPGVIIHGRYDVICPVDQAYSLKNVWPKADLKIIRDAGHAATEPGIVDALIHATDKFANNLFETP